MREIEFRCWNKSDKEFEYLEDMVINDIVLSLPSYKIYKINRYYDDLHDQFYIEKIDVTDEYELLQYTGRKDKYGKKIFEGDIGKDKFGTRPLICKFYVGSAAFVWVDFEDDGIQVDLDCFVEVIGNIYENPELLS